MEVVLGKFVGRFEPGVGFLWDLPPGVIASIDITNPAEWDGYKLDVGARVGNILCLVADGTVDETFVRLASGVPGEAKSSGLIVDAWESRTKFRPAGDTITDLLWDHVTRGADPAGLDAIFPIIPEADLGLRLWANGLLLRGEKFRLGSHSHSAKLVAFLKRDLRAARADAIASRIRNRSGSIDNTAHRKVMDWWCDKLSDRNPALKAAVFNVLRPADWPVDEQPITHETVLTENFNTANGPTLGPNQTWTQLGGATTVDTNQARITTNPGVNRCDNPVSGDDQYCQVIVTTRAGNVIATVQWNSGNLQRYSFLQSSSQSRLARVTAAGSLTVYATTSNAWPTAPFTIRHETSGSSLKGIVNGTTVVGPQSDFTFNGNRRGGFEGSAAAGQWFDDWEFGDLGGSTFNESVSLAGAANLSHGAVISIPVAINLQTTSTITESPSNVMPNAVQLAASANIQELARLITSSALSLTVNAGFLASLQLAGGPQTFNESVGLATLAGLSLAAQSQITSSVLLAANVAMSVTMQQVIRELISVGVSAALIPQAKAIYQEAIAIAVRAAFQAEANTGSIYAPVADAVWRLDPNSNVFRLDPNSPVWRLDHQ